MNDQALRRSPMMAHLLDAAARGEDIGHYGRLTLAIVGHHFLDDDDLVQILGESGGTDEHEARALVQQVHVRNYNPPRRERILEWQAQQEFPICPNPEDPDACNLYRELDLPEEVFEHIEEYREQQAEAAHKLEAAHDAKESPKAAEPHPAKQPATPRRKAGGKRA